MNPVQSISLQVLQSGDSYYAVLEAQTPVGAYKAGGPWFQKFKTPTGRLTHYFGSCSIWRTGGDFATANVGRKPPGYPVRSASFAATEWRRDAWHFRVAVLATY